MKKLLIGLILLLTLNVYSQSDSTRLNSIDSTLREYGRQQTIANKITIISISSIVIGTIVGIPATPLLIINTACDFVTIIVSSKSNKKLAKHKSN